MNEEIPTYQGRSPAKIKACCRFREEQLTCRLTFLGARVEESLEKNG
jgi:hypothetical protein